ncbi:MAG: hypothetical protein ACRYFS_19745 [Janthinobacterium lividum]
MSEPRSALPASTGIVASTDIPVASHPFPQSQETQGSLESAPLGLLPTPTPEDVAGFAVLYERKYGAKLDSDQARRLLAGLMRFLYLTRTASPRSSSADPPNSVDPSSIDPAA